MEGSKAQCESMYETLTEEPGGAELLSLPKNEILQQQYLTQLGAHPILKWIDCADVIEAFWALCDVKAFGVSADDNEALSSFMELASTNIDFMTGSAFWQNVYKLWLSNYARIARPSFSVKLQKFLQEFNDKNKDAGLEVFASNMHSKTYDEL